MRDAFAVLFFVSVGMLFDHVNLLQSPLLVLATLAIIMVGSPLAAFGLVLACATRSASPCRIAVAAGQIGEFSFILASLAYGAQHSASRSHERAGGGIGDINHPEPSALQRHRTSRALAREQGDRVGGEGAADRRDAEIDEAAHRVIVVGYGPVGRTLSRILRDNGIQVVVIETNLETVRELRAKGELAVYGDASLREVLHHAGIEQADGLIIAASGAPAQAIVKAARELNPKIRVLSRAAYLRESPKLREAGANAVFSSEGEVALAMTAFLMRQLGATDEQIDRERDRVRAELFEVEQSVPASR